MPRPKVLVIGNSISLGYTPHVAEWLKDRAEVLHNPGNGGDSDNVLAHLQEWLSLGPFAAVHFNCGLHDIKFSRHTRRHQVPLDRYRTNLQAICRRLAQTGARLVWATTTPVIEDRHQAAKDFDRYNRDVDAYNAVAREVVRHYGIAVNDLHAAALSGGLEQILTADGVHFTDAGYRLLGGQAGRCLGALPGC